MNSTNGLAGLGHEFVLFKKRVRSRLDPKLSDGGGLAQPVPNAITSENQPELNAAPDAEAQAVTARSRSLQRMVRRFGCPGHA